MPAPTVVRSWAPRGQTPNFHHSQRHDRFSAISGISVGPTRHRAGRYYQWHHHNIREIEAVAFLRHLLRHLLRHVGLVWDNLGAHKGKLVKKPCRRVSRLHPGYLAACAPELNPDNGVWRHAEGPLANGCPADRFDLALDVMRELERLRRSPARLWSRARPVFVDRSIMPRVG
jgi:hypothetical protein